MVQVLRVADTESQMTGRALQSEVWQCGFTGGFGTAGPTAGLTGL